VAREWIEPIGERRPLAGTGAGGRRGADGRRGPHGALRAGAIRSARRRGSTRSWPVCAPGWRKGPISGSIPPRISKGISTLSSGSPACGKKPTSAPPPRRFARCGRVRPSETSAPATRRCGSSWREHARSLERRRHSARRGQAVAPACPPSAGAGGGPPPAGVAVSEATSRACSSHDGGACRWARSGAPRPHSRRRPESLSGGAPPGPSSSGGRTTRRRSPRSRLRRRLIKLPRGFAARSAGAGNAATRADAPLLLSGLLASGARAAPAHGRRRWGALSLGLAVPRPWPPPPTPFLLAGST